MRPGRCSGSAPWSSTTAAAEAGSEWLPGFAKEQQELPPQKGGRSVDRTEGLLTQRIGQLQIHKQVAAAAPGAENETIRRQLKLRLCNDYGCELVSAVTANLSDPLVLKNFAKETREAAGRRRSAKAKRRRDGWHSWLADQK